MLTHNILPTLLENQFSSVAQSCPTLCNPINCSTTGLPVHHQLPEFTQTHVHWVSDASQPTHPLSSPSLPAFNLAQHKGLFQSVSSSNQVSPSTCHEVMGLDAMILVFWMLSYKSIFSLSFFTFIKTLFSSSLSTIRVVSWGYWYFSRQFWFQFVFLPAQRFSWCTLHIS